jgi:hypothetical protein
MVLSNLQGSFIINSSLNDCCFKESLIDPCLWIKYSKSELSWLLCMSMTVLLLEARCKLDTKLHYLKLQQKHECDKWDLVLHCNSNWPGDPESRISVTGFIMYLLGVPICWRYKAQKGVTLSSSEAEYVAMSSVLSFIC